MSMFSSALKSISATNIGANYTVSPSPISSAGPWRIHDAKKKSSGKPYSVFIFDRKSLDAHGSSLGRSGAAAYKKVTEEVTERLKKEASSLARLRHPSVLELVEPVEETRGGGLQFVTEPVTASLASLLQEKDEQERSGGVGGRSSRYVTEDSDGTRRRRDLEIDELEIQKGLLQVSKALEFLHDNAGLVHGNLTPDAVIVNAKSDWKISGLSFCSPAEGSTKPTSFQPLSLYEVLNPDARLPRTVQLSIDYTSPDFVLDNNLNASADMFSLGLLSVALYNSPHKSPIECHGSLSNYKRVFQSSSSVPNASNNYLSSRPIPKDLAAHVLPRLLTRRPAQRLTAKEFQESEFFDNILVSTIRFLDSFPEKTPNEKAQFLRGLNKVLASFPKSVMEKKLLPALLEETKDKELLALILGNVFKIVGLLPAAKRAFGDKVRPVLKEVFVNNNTKQAEEKDPAKDAGLMVVLENVGLIADNVSGKEFADDILPVIIAAMMSTTPAVVDTALRSLSVTLPVLDFGTIKNVLFPVVAVVFSKTNSLAIKVRGLQAFVVLCGGTLDGNMNDGLDGIGDASKKTSSSTALDKYTMQEKIVPLIKGIKTKEPAVMIAALRVLAVVGEYADADFVATDILPVLWQMSLGPLLDLKQFQTFMELIKTLSRRVEDEQTKKLQETGAVVSSAIKSPADDFMSFQSGVSGTHFDVANGAGNEDDFARLVKGKASGKTTDMMDGGQWDSTASPAQSRVASPGVQAPLPASQPTPAFSWSTPSPTRTGLPLPGASIGGSLAQSSSFRTITPDLGRFEAMTPSSTQFSQPMQPQTLASATSSSSAVNWSAAAASNPWATAQTNSSSSNMGAPTSTFNTPMNSNTAPMSSMASSQLRPSFGNEARTSSGFSLPPPPGQSQSSQQYQQHSLRPPPGSNRTMHSSMGMGMMMQNRSHSASNMGTGSTNNMMGNMSLNGGIPQQQLQQQQIQPQAASKSGLDKYQSLL